MGAIEALTRHGSDALKALYLPRLVSGKWTATMNLTEPQAGSDLGALTTRAERRGDGTYRLFGQKIFITYGEHDLAENIVHLVLARLPDAPPGSQGHLALPRAEVPGRARTARIGARNDVVCAGLEKQARHPRLADLHDDLRRRPLRRRARARSAGSSARSIAGSIACSR